MRSEIKINNSRLKIVPLEADSSGVVILRSKKYMKYQEVVMTGPTGFTVRSTAGIGKFKVDPLTATKYPDIWALEVSRTKYTDIEYTDSEIKIIVSFLASVVMYYQDTAELLSHCTGDLNIIDGFYRAYGKTGIVNYIEYLKGLLGKWNEYNAVPVGDRKYPRSYERDKYSVQKLIADLIEDKASILTDKELIGEYQRISLSGGSWDSNAVTPVTDEWFPITGYLGNLTRANLSIVYEAKIKVDIPSNTYGIPAGLQEFPTTKSMCLIKDGILNQSLLGVKISSKLAGKLKRLGVVCANLVCQDEYFIDISRLPIISKSWIRGFNSISMSRLEINLLLSKVGLEYISFVDPKLTSEEPDEKTKFLNDLGIYNGKYSGKFTAKSSGKSYTSLTLVSNITGIPQTKADREKMYKDFIATGTCGNKVLSQLLKTIKATPEEKKKWQDKYANYSNQLRDRKFQMIMSKRSRFEEPGQPFIDEVHKTVEVYEGVRVNVSWSFINKKIYV